MKTGLDHRSGHARVFFPCRKNSLSLKQLAAWKKHPGMACLSDVNGQKMNKA